MTKVLRRYAEKHRHGGDAVGSGLPTAAAKAALSFYADLQSPPAGLRVCRGTSCALAGAAELQEELGRGFDCRAVYCLGYCDRSPAVMRGDDELFLRCHAEDLRAGHGAIPAPPAIRSLGREPLLTRRLTLGGCADLDRARANGAYAALEGAIRRPREEIISTLERSGERGRGGAGYSTGAKWRTCAQTPSGAHYIVANGDEGDPGSFIDRLLLEGDPHAIIEGMILGAYAIGAREGIVFIRSEYPVAAKVMEAAIGEARRARLLGPSILATDFGFDLAVVRGMGSYVCGEETALLNAIEGLRGEVRLRPPYPAVEGLHGKPTVVNNVETLANVPLIVGMGAVAYAALGTQTCSGTKVMCLNHGFARPGVVEVEFGVPLRQVIEEAGGGAGGRRLEAVLLGGPMGSVLLPDEWDVPVCYTAMSARGIQLGHGGVVAVPEGTDFRALVLHWADFMRDESCGKCVPCRLGSQRVHELLSAGDRAARPQLERLLDVIEQGSLCAFGQLVPRPLRQLLEHFGDRVLGDRP